MIAALLLTAALQSTAPWLVIDETSQLDGQRSFTAGVESTNDVPNVLGRPAKAMLAMSCADGQRRVFISWPRYMGRDETRVAWKFDDGQIQEQRFEIPTGGRMAFLSGRAAERFLDGLSGAERVVMQVGGTSEAVFETPEAASQVETVRAACPGR